MRIYCANRVSLLVFVLSSACTSDSGDVSFSNVSAECEAWIGIIGLNDAEGGYHDLIEETRTIPLILPPDDHSVQWGFALPCEDDQSCSVSYALYSPKENWGDVTVDDPSLERTITTPPGGVVRSFGWDPGDYYGTWRLVVGRDGKTVCDTTVQVVE